MLRILAEVTGKTEEEFAWTLEAVAEKDDQVRANLDEKLPEQEAAKLMNDLRQEKEGILAWLVRGAMMVHAKTPGRHQ